MLQGPSGMYVKLVNREKRKTYSLIRGGRESASFLKYLTVRLTLPRHNCFSTIATSIAAAGGSSGGQIGGVCGR